MTYQAKPLDSGNSESVTVTVPDKEGGHLADWPEEIQDIGDLVATMPLCHVSLLTDYLRQEYGIELTIHLG